MVLTSIKPNTPPHLHLQPSHIDLLRNTRILHVLRPQPPRLRDKIRTKSTTVSAFLRSRYAIDAGSLGSTSRIDFVRARREMLLRVCEFVVVCVYAAGER